MSDSHHSVRAASIHALAWVSKTESDGVLLEALYAKDQSVSHAAAEALALNASSDDQRVLKDALRSRSFGARRAASAGLRLVAEPWATVLLAKSMNSEGLFLSDSAGPSISDEEGDAQAASWRRAQPGDQPWLVAWAVEQGRVVPVGQAAVPLLLEALEDSEAAIRMRAAATLGQLAVVDGIGPLKKALVDESPEVRQAAFIALGKIGRAWDIDT
jgi:HEAT repeat protein